LHKVKGGKNLSVNPIGVLGFKKGKGKIKGCKEKPLRPRKDKIKKRKS